MPVRRGIYLTQDSLDNWNRARCHTTTNSNRWSHRPNKRGFQIVTSEEVLRKMFELGVKRDLRTLQRYAKKDLISKPSIQYLGRGKGKVSDWPATTPYEFFASWKLCNALGFEDELVVSARKLALEARNSSGGTFLSKLSTIFEKNPEYGKILKEKDVAEAISLYWIILQDKELGKFNSDFLIGGSSITFPDGELEKYKNFNPE